MTGLPSTQLDSTRLDVAALDSTRLGRPRLDSTRLDSTRPGRPRLDSTRPPSTRLDSAALDSPRLGSTRLDWTRLGKSDAKAVVDSPPIHAVSMLYPYYIHAVIMLFEPQPSFGRSLASKHQRASPWPSAMAGRISEQAASVSEEAASITNSEHQEGTNEIDTELAFVEETLRDLGWPWIQLKPSVKDLAKMLSPVKPLDFGPIAADAAYSVHDCSALDLPASFGRDVGFRAVSQQGLTSKIKDIMLAKAWRSWDVLRLATVEDEIVYVDFHIRGCSLLTILRTYQQRARPLPRWLQRMARKLPTEWHGKLDRTTWLSRCLSRAIALEHGSIAMSWLDVVHHCRKDASMVDSLHHRMRLDCPEHYEKVANWKRLQALSERVTEDAYTALAHFMHEDRCKSDVLIGGHMGGIMGRCQSATSNATHSLNQSYDEHGVAALFKFCLSCNQFPSAPSKHIFRGRPTRIPLGLALFSCSLEMPSKQRRP